MRNAQLCMLCLWITWNKWNFQAVLFFSLPNTNFKRFAERQFGSWPESLAEGKPKEWIIWKCFNNWRTILLEKKIKKRKRILSKKCILIFFLKKKILQHYLRQQMYILQQFRRLENKLFRVLLHRFWVRHGFPWDDIWLSPGNNNNLYYYVI